MSTTEYAAADDGAVASAPPMMVHVVAPSSLPEGYTFEAQVGNDPERTFTVEVVSASLAALLDGIISFGFHIDGSWRNVMLWRFRVILQPSFFALLTVSPSALSHINSPPVA